MEYIKKYWIVIVIIFGISIFTAPAFCLLILGSLLLYVSCMSFLFQLKLCKRGIEVNGRIISYQANSKGQRIPMIEFKTAHNELITEEPLIYASTDLSIIESSSNIIDKEVVIVYDPEDPKKYIVKDEKDLNYFALLLALLVALGFITVGFGSLLGYIELG
jgi:hypothetical protein